MTPAQVEAARERAKASTEGVLTPVPVAFDRGLDALIFGPDGDAICYFEQVSDQATKDAICFAYARRDILGLAEECDRLRNVLLKISSFYVGKDGMCGGAAVQLASDAIGRKKCKRCRGTGSVELVNLVGGLGPVGMFGEGECVRCKGIGYVGA